ncbi:uncharacterized protein BCR38DRAFT_202642 [Pseudomassariella vexata]|uniref:Uncharacterized protein n=1 Tax=Pseudomassariella vexata TaxID=1141098 RepID=A0A1Y2DXU0_9PEZI|nr:uncharacterized protein BCR38DRAFT_202642 [Pseudomassariella vexata]ORY63934.1 hypothetical protein BCR38DRAFT_202642 [Pseudomassariella vexata]
MVQKNKSIYWASLGGFSKHSYRESCRWPLTSLITKSSAVLRKMRGSSSGVCASNSQYIRPATRRDVLASEGILELQPLLKNRSGKDLLSKRRTLCRPLYRDAACQGGNGGGFRGLARRVAKELCSVRVSRCRRIRSLIAEFQVVWVGKLKPS